MRTFTKEEVLMNQEKVLDRIKAGEIFIYPTDTIYGIGCNALNNESVNKIRKIKQRPETPFSVIVPGKDWIHENCDNSPQIKEWVDKLPGPYTLILPLKNKQSISKNTNNNKDSIGVRIPDHWFFEIPTMLNIPIITTSVNKSEKPFMTNLDDLDHDIKSHINFIIYEGEIKGKASNIVHLEGNKVKVTER